MRNKLDGLDCIIRPLALTNKLVNPSDPTKCVSYPEEFIVMEHADYGSLHELI